VFGTDRKKDKQLTATFSRFGVLAKAFLKGTRCILCHVAHRFVRHVESSISSEAWLQRRTWMTGTKFQISTKLASEAVAKTTFSLQILVINETDHGLSSYTVRVKLAHS
jgi:hypothetical protein